MKTVLLLLGIVASSVSCAAECSFPREVQIPASWLIEYRGVADTARYTDQSIFLDWDDGTKRLLINGDPYPVPSSTQYSDEKWMAVPRYAELRQQGKSSNEAGRIYEQEKRALLDSANEEFRRRLAHHFTDDMDPAERAAAIQNISQAEKDEALARADEILKSHPFVQNTGEQMHLDAVTSQITVEFYGQRPLEVRLDVTGRHVREEYTRDQACHLAEHFDALDPGVSGVIILQGGGRRTLRGTSADRYRASVR